VRKMLVKRNLAFIEKMDCNDAYVGRNFIDDNIGNSEWSGKFICHLKKQS